MVSMEAPLPLRVGTRGVVRPRKGPPSRFIVTDLVTDRVYEDTTLLPGARLVFRHEARQYEDRTEVVTAATISGVLARLWERMLRKDIAAHLQSDLDALVEIVEASATANTEA